MTIKQIKENYKNYKTVGNEKNSFVVTHYVGYGKCVIVVNSDKIYGKAVTQIIRVEDGKELLQEDIRPCDNLSDALDVAEEMLRERLSENKEIVQSFNEMNSTNYSSLEEIQEIYSKAEIFQSWLEYEGIYGYTAKILYVLETLEKQ